ncbi:MAG: deoxyribose-phosphate aldolase [Rhizobiaceae bacterium]
MSSESRKQIATRALGMVDLTDLNEGCTNEAIDALCARAQTPFGPVGAICIWPRFVAHAHGVLHGSGIPIATVVNFPSGNQSIEETETETKKALEDGADEIDLVIPYRAFIAGDDDAVKAMVTAVRRASASRALLKVIIETGELETATLIKKASHLAIDAGADFIKTSTGKVPINATPEVAELMIQAIADSKKDVGFKPAGGIKTTEDCGNYLAIADRIMGEGWATNETFRFGASSVLSDLLAALDGANAVKSDGY